MEEIVYLITQGSEMLTPAVLVRFMVFGLLAEGIFGIVGNIFGGMHK